jgi:peptide/nickel transport system permease protein
LQLFLGNADEAKRWQVKTLAAHIGRIAALILLAGLASALLARFSPGALVDEGELDSRMSQATLENLRAKRAAENSLGDGFLQFLRGASRGDLGVSRSRNAPIAELIASNAPATLRRIGVGLAGAWFAGLGLAFLAARFHRASALDAGVSLAAGLLLSLPAALLAYFCLTAGAGVDTVLMLVLVPRVFRFSRNLLTQAYGSPCIDMARARGIGETAVLFRHVFPAVAPQLLALSAATVNMAVGAIIPIETICDTPGLGRLAWQAATSRDLPLLVNLTVLIALATTVAMSLSDAASRRSSEATA